MFIDALQKVAAALAITATGVSDSIDLGAAPIPRQIGDGEPVGFGFAIGVDADHTTGDETYTFEVIESAAAALTSPNVIASRSFTAAQAVAGALVAGTRFFIGIPQGTPNLRYIGVRATLGGTTPTITYSAWLSPRSMFSQEPHSYPKGFTA